MRLQSAVAFLRLAHLSLGYEGGQARRLYLRVPPVSVFVLLY
jgi:hypothetical protein